MIRVDRWTGEVTIIDGDKIVKAKTADEQLQETKNRESLAKTKFLAPIDLTPDRWWHRWPNAVVAQ
jgi:hypothetical protein